MGYHAPPALAVAMAISLGDETFCSAARPQSPVTRISPKTTPVRIIEPFLFVIMANTSTQSFTLYLRWISVSPDVSKNALHEPGQAGRKGFEANLLASQHRRAFLQARSHLK
jgi:hypothetical protein